MEYPDTSCLQDLFWETAKKYPLHSIVPFLFLTRVEFVRESHVHRCGCLSRFILRGAGTQKGWR